MARSGAAGGQEAEQLRSDQRRRLDLVSRSLFSLVVRTGSISRSAELALG